MSSAPVPMVVTPEVAKLRQIEELPDDQPAVQPTVQPAPFTIVGFLHQYISVIVVVVLVLLSGIAIYLWFYAATPPPATPPQPQAAPPQPQAAPPVAPQATPTAPQATPQCTQQSCIVSPVQQPPHPPVNMEELKRKAQENVDQVVIELPDNVDTTVGTVNTQYTPPTDDQSTVIDITDLDLEPEPEPALPHTKCNAVLPSGIMCQVAKAKKSDFCKIHKVQQST